jgi:hypothetical protein
VKWQAIGHSRSGNSGLQPHSLIGSFDQFSYPFHGSWLNMAEIELSVLARQALSGRLPTLDAVQERVAAWQERRNQYQATISWRFTTADARIKLKRLYPSIEA